MKSFFRDLSKLEMLLLIIYILLVAVGLKLMIL